MIRDAVGVSEAQKIVDWHNKYPDKSQPHEDDEEDFGFPWLSAPRIRKFVYWYRSKTGHYADPHYDWNIYLGLLDWVRGEIDDEHDPKFAQNLDDRDLRVYGEIQE
jgi:hypothetical protein